MGYNTTIVVMNDALGQIAQDSKFGEKVASAVTKAISGKRIDIEAGNHCNAAHVVETHHADETVIITVGGNLGIKQHHAHGWHHNEVDTQRELCKAWAKKLGLEVVDKAKVPAA